MALPEYVVWFRGRPACPCLAEWLPAYEAELQRRGILAGELHIYQLIGGYVGSGGTHATGGAFDLLDLPGEEDLWVGRQMGADAYWTRPENWDGDGGIRHNHGVLRGCPHNGPARYQIESPTFGVDHNRDGLSHGGRGAPDTGPRPLSGRTWREGIAWAKEQQRKEWDEMASKDEIRQVVAEEIEKAFKARLGNGRTVMSTINLIAGKVGVKPKPEKG